MASRRMFSFRIINSAKFLKMPLEAQSLYFHLGVRADDDGVAEAYPVMKLLGATEDNLKILFSKGFIDLLNDDLVVFITDFYEHNTIRSDRKINSIYSHLLSEKNIETIKPRPRSDVKDNSKRLGGQSMDNQRTAQVKLSKVKLSKPNIIKRGESIKQKEEKFIKELKNILGDIFGEAISKKGIEEAQKFIAYWTEPNKSKSKLRYEMEKTWDIKRRFGFWLKNAEKFGGSKNNQNKTLEI